jgi:hypothetical protein
VVAGTVLAPVYWIYAQAREASGASEVVRTLDDARGWSANLASYLASSAVAHEWWLSALQARQRWNDVLFPGLGLVLLAGYGAIAMRSAETRRIRWTYAGLAVVACWASFGPDAGLYQVLFVTVPGMSLLRAPARLGILVTLALAVLAGFGAARLVRRRSWLSAALVVMIAAELGVRTEAWGWPSWPLRETGPLPAAYRRLAELPRGALVEYQFPYERSNFHNHATAMYWSSYHWQPLVNGYSDLIPADFGDIVLPINYFPDAESFRIMKARNVRYVLWHIADYRGAGEAVITERLERYAAYLRPLARDDDIWLYEITGWPDDAP